MVFVVLHLACQAYRAGTSGALPAPGLEVEPWFVAGALCIVWLPFAGFAGFALRRSWFSARTSPSALGASASALAVIEPLALALTLSFAVVHGALVAWPLLSGAVASVDVRPELVAALSSTTHGVPMQAILYLCGVGAASFCASRQTLQSLHSKAKSRTRAATALGICAYLLGVYAVIRCASGSLLP